MKMDKISEASPAKIGILYLLFIVLIMVLCVRIIGTKTILMSAMAQKPYSVQEFPQNLFLKFHTWCCCGRIEAVGM